MKTADGSITFTIGTERSRGADSKKGVTLIETMAAILVIAIAAVASLQFYAFCQRSFITNAASNSMAANFARETMEDYYFSDYNDSDLNVGNYNTVPITGSSLANNHNGTRSYTVTQPIGTGYKLIETKVHWDK